MNKEKEGVYINTVNTIRSNISSAKKKGKRVSFSQEKMGDTRKPFKVQLFPGRNNSQNNKSIRLHNNRHCNKKIDSYFRKIQSNFDFSYFKNKIKNDNRNSRKEKESYQNIKDNSIIEVD